MSDISRQDDGASEVVHRGELKKLAAHASYAARLTALESDPCEVTILRAPPPVKRNAGSGLLSDATYHEDSLEIAAAWDKLRRLEASDPRRIRLAMEFVYEFSHAGSAVLSVLQPNESGHLDCVWQVVCGALAAHEGDGTPRNFGPCGLCLDAGYPMFLSRPAQKFDYLDRIQPALFETLIIPLYSDRGVELGTCWVTHHDPVARFNVNDVSLLERASGYVARSLLLPASMSLRGY
ncbi:MAG TPA: hypothetical protein VIU34_16665 [Steroidobacter sp.]